MCPVMKLCVEGLCSCNCLIVELSLVLLKQPRLGGVLSRCGRLHLDFGDLNLDEIANGDETFQPEREVKSKFVGFARDPYRTSWALRVRASGILSPGVVGSVSRQRVDDAGGMSVSERMDPTHGQV